MTRAALDARCKPQQFSLADRRVAELDAGDFGVAVGQRAGLVECHHVHFGELLEIDSALDENAAAGRAGDGGDHYQWRRQSQLGWGCENQQGHDQPHVSSDQKNDQQEHEHDRDQDARHAIRQFLHRRLLRLSALDERDDSRVSRVLPDFERFNVERPEFEDRAREDARANGFLDRQALAGDRGLVDRRLPVFNDAVHRDFLTRPHDHDFADAQLRHRQRQLFGSAAHERGLRHGTDQGFDRGSSAVGVEVGDELGDQDDHQQHRSGHVLAAEHGDASGDGDEDFRADFALVNQVEQADLDERVESERQRGEQHR